MKIILHLIVNVKIIKAGNVKLYKLLYSVLKYRIGKAIMAIQIMHHVSAIIECL